MRVLVDGNNLVFAARNTDPGDVLIGRQIVCQTLGQWATRYRHEVRIVFDGRAPARGFGEQLADANVELTFSGESTADDTLTDLLNADSAARRMLVVSSDRQVQRAAGRRLAKSIKAEEFWLAVARDLARPLPEPGEPPAKRYGSESDDETRGWLDEFGFQ